MSLSINGNPPEYYGVAVAARSYRNGNADTLQLDLAREVATGAVADLEYGDEVILTRGSVTLFRGVVREVPQQESGTEAGQTVMVYGPWDSLERLVFQRSVTRVIGLDVVTGEPVEATVFTAHFTQGRAGQNTGVRMKEALDYAAAESGAFLVGTIAAGLPWTPSEVRDQTCADVVRQLLALNPELVVAWDYGTTPPTVSVATVGGAVISQSILGVNGCADFAVTPLAGQACSEVVLRHEYVGQGAVDFYLATTVDAAFSAPATGDGKSDNAYVRTIGLEPGSVQWETASVGLDAIAQAADATATKAAWWVRKDDRLRALNERVGQAAPGLAGVLAGLLKFPAAAAPEDDIVPHLVMVAGVAERDDLFGDAPVPSVDPADYPKEIVGGTLPEWAGKRYRQVVVESTIGILASDLEAVASPTIKGALGKIFSVEKSFDGMAYLVSNFAYSGMATNATVERYRRPSSSQPAEALPVGLAAALLASYGRTRFAGNVTLIGQEARDDFYPGQTINLVDGDAAWATMGELVQSVEIDDAAGQTTVSFGPPSQLSAEDLIERLRVARRNPVSYTFEDDPPKEMVGGIAATPNSSSARDGGAAAEYSHPWKCSSSADGIVVAEGFIFFVDARGSTLPDLKPIAYVPEKCATDTLTVTALGYIYAVVGKLGSAEFVGGIESAFSTASNLMVFTRGVAAISLIFTTADPPDLSAYSIAFTVAKVDLVDGVAVVLEQYLTHNPTHDLVYVVQDN